MENEPDPLAQFGLDAIDLRWTLKDIASKRFSMLAGLRTRRSVFEIGRWSEGYCAGFPAARHHPSASKPAMQPTAITIRPLIIMNVSSLTLNIAHPIKNSSDQPDCRRWRSRILWLRCNEPFFYCGKKMAETAAHVLEGRRSRRNAASRVADPSMCRNGIGTAISDRRGGFRWSGAQVASRSRQSKSKPSAIA
jgi:hypothetical protein